MAGGLSVLAGFYGLLIPSGWAGAVVASYKRNCSSNISLERGTPPVRDFTEASSFVKTASRGTSFQPLGAGSYPDATHSVEVLTGHVYAVFTGDNHYAKIWVTGLHAGDFGYTCLVAYQPQAGNNDLKPR